MIAKTSTRSIPKHSERFFVFNTAPSSAAFIKGLQTITAARLKNTSSP
jgi:hypothetical protein